MNSVERSRPIEVLLAEDDSGDVRLTQEAMRDAKVHNRLTVARDGEEALAVLRRQGPWEGAPRPDLMLLDLNMPKKSGLEVLEEMKHDEDLKTIPVVILTSSDAERDIVRSYRLHANCYVKKPLDLKQFLEVTRTIEEFWLCIVTLPATEQTRQPLCSAQ